MGLKRQLTTTSALRLGRVRHEEGEVRHRQFLGRQAGELLRDAHAPSRFDISVMHYVGKHARLAAQGPSQGNPS